MQTIFEFLKGQKPYDKFLVNRGNLEVVISSPGVPGWYKVITVEQYDVEVKAGRFLDGDEVALGHQLLPKHGTKAPIICAYCGLLSYKPIKEINQTPTAKYRFCKKLHQDYFGRVKSGA